MTNDDRKKARDLMEIAERMAPGREREDKIEEAEELGGRSDRSLPNRKK